jgi:hypothetical protein
MPDDLYHTDILGWSRAQAERLRRLQRGERVNDVDWEHVIEEIEDLGKSEFRTVTSNLRNAFLHALKVIGWPDHDAGDHWTQEITTFLGNARDRFEPGMQQHVDPAAIYELALQDLRGAPPIGGVAPQPLPERVELTAAELRDRRFGASDLLARLRAALPPA